MKITELNESGLPLQMRLSKAKRNGETTLVVTTEELDRLYAQMKAMDERLSQWFDMLTDEQKDQVSKDMFG
jgi:hypothetical protein